MKIAIIGSGAVGAYYGSLLARVGQEVHFLFNSDYDHVKKHGLQVESPNGDFSLPKINAYKSAESMPKCDVVIVATKTTVNAELMPRVIPQVIHENSWILTLQNGLGLEEFFQEIAPNAKIFGGLCFLCSNKIGDGHIRHIDYGKIKLGHYSKSGAMGLSSELQELEALLKRGGIETELSDDIIRARWEKLVWNIPFNGLCTVMGKTTDELCGFEHTRSLLFDLMAEVLRGAKLCSYAIPNEFADFMMKLSDDMEAYSPSMKLDYEGERAMELDAIYWNALSQVSSCGGDMPKVRALVQQLELMDRDRFRDN